MNIVNPIKKGDSNIVLNTECFVSISLGSPVDFKPYNLVQPDVPVRGPVLTQYGGYETLTNTYWS